MKKFDFLSGYKTKIGVLISSIAPILQILGYEFDPESAIIIVNELFNAAGHILTAYGLIIWSIREIKKFIDNLRYA